MAPLLLNEEARGFQTDMQTTVVSLLWIGSLLSAGLFATSFGASVAQARAGLAPLGLGRFLVRPTHPALPLANAARSPESWRRQASSALAGVVEEIDHTQALDKDFYPAVFNYAFRAEQDNGLGLGFEDAKNFADGLRSVDQGGPAQWVVFRIGYRLARASTGLALTDAAEARRLARHLASAPDPVIALRVFTEAYAYAYLEPAGLKFEQRSGAIQLAEELAVTADPVTFLDLHRQDFALRFRRDGATAREKVTSPSDLIRSPRQQAGQAAPDAPGAHQP